MNWLDKTVGFLSPVAGMRRARARAAFDLARTYDAGKTGRRSEGWTVSGGSANAEVTASLATMRNRSRSLVQNNPYAKRAIATLTAKSIGTGIRGRPEKGAKAAWDEFVETCDHEGDLDLYGIQSMIARGAFESGEMLVRRMRVGADGGRVPLKLQVLEPDYVDSSKNGLLSNGNYVIAGVEIDRQGRKQAYWLFDEHPGDVTWKVKRFQSKPVPASEIILFGRKDRAGQLRYAPELAAGIMRLRDYDDWREAVLMKKKIEACFAAFVSGSDPALPLGEATLSSTTGKRTEQLAPGMIEYLGNDRTVTFANPSSAVDAGFAKDELHAIAMAAGVTYEQMTGDLSGVNYSSIRSGMGDFRDLIEMWRWIYFIPMVMRRINGWFMEAAYDAGSIKSLKYKMVWTPPSWPYVNPVDDIKASKEEILGGIQSLSEKIRERGYDPDEVFAEMAEDKAKLAALGLVVDTDASLALQMAEAKAEPAAPDEAPEPTPAVVQAAPQITIHNTLPPDAIRVEVAPAQITIAPAAITVNIPPAEVRNDITTPAPQVHVDGAQITVNAYAKRTVETVQRDARGEIVSITRDAAE